MINNLIIIIYMAQEVTKSIKYGLVALSGLFGAAYLYYDFKKSEKELK
jgi:hypothetical protein